MTIREYWNASTPDECGRVPLVPFDSDSLGDHAPLLWLEKNRDGIIYAHDVGGTASLREDENENIDEFVREWCAVVGKDVPAEYEEE